MIQVCYFCKQVYGEKEPLENKEETHGECNLCHHLFKVWYHLWRNKNTDETATKFILRYRDNLERSANL